MVTKVEQIWKERCCCGLCCCKRRNWYVFVTFVIVITDIVDISLSLWTMIKLYVKDTNSERVVESSYLMVHSPFMIVLAIKLYYGIRWCLNPRKRRALQPFYRWSLTYSFSEFT